MRRGSLPSPGCKLSGTLTRSQRRKAAVFRREHKTSSNFLQTCRKCVRIENVFSTSYDTMWTESPGTRLNRLKNVNLHVMLYFLRSVQNSGSYRREPSGTSSEDGYKCSFCLLLSYGQFTIFLSYHNFRFLFAWDFEWWKSDICWTLYGHHNDGLDTK